MKLRSAPLIAVLVSVAAAASRARADELAQLLERARSASGIVAFQQGGKDLLLEGTATVNGIDGKWSVRAASDGSFTTFFDARLSLRDGFDGATVWRVDPSGMPTTILFQEREHALLAACIGYGTWCVESGPIGVLGVVAKSEKEEDAAAAAVRLRARDGLLEVKLELDAKTALPKALHYEAMNGPEEWRWSDWRPEGGLAIAHEFAIDDGGQKSVYHIARSQLVEAAGAEAFTPPSTRPDDVKFDAGAPSRLSGKLAVSRHLLVKARIDAHDVGWFVFDSGAGGACINPALADELKLPAFGELWLGGAGEGRASSHFREATELTLGPMTMAHPRFVELDMKELEGALGTKLAGICGYDVLMRATAVVDMTKGTVDLFDPRDSKAAPFTRSDVTWRALTLYGNHPHVQCTFEQNGEEEGIFRLDTGAAGVGVMFHSPTVRALGLLENRKTTVAQGIGGIGGQSKTRVGRLTWFELGGVTVDEPQVVFTEDERGAFADPWTYGTIGSTMLSKFDLILDYPHHRIGFVAHE